MRYKIPKYIQFASEETRYAANTTEAKTSIYIINTQTDTSFLINFTIKSFIEKFSIPLALDDLAKQLSNELNTSFEEIKKLIIPFFNYCRHRQFIVPENFTDTQIETIPLFNPGCIVDHYKIITVIGVNHDIDVYHATDLIAETEVIIKLLKNTEKKNICIFQREFNFLQSLQHTHIAPEPYKLIANNDFVYFSQSFIRGLSLPQFIHRTSQASYSTILTITTNILQAFAKIHATDIVHGDIHPSNIMLTDDCRVKIIDFGLAINTATDTAEIISFGGAYFFMPPERIKKTTHKKFTRKPDFFSDVFQLGVVLYVLLYDAYPFNGITWEELATEIKEKQVAFPFQSKYNFLVPDWLKTIIIKCVAKKPKHRYVNANELCAAFKKSLNNDCKIRSAVKV